MTRLRKTMLEELERPNFSQNTTRTYVRIVEDFARYFHQPHPQRIRARGKRSRRFGKRSGGSGCSELIE